MSEYAANKMSHCNSVLQRKIPNQLFNRVSFNGITYSDDRAMFILGTNRTHEFLVTSNFHPFHQHTWPFQVQRDVVQGWLAQSGDWRDTLGASGSFLARSNLLTFSTGKLVQHCHFVPHEDNGMMAYHKLETDNDFNANYTPIQPSIHTGVHYSNPSKSEWVSADDCEEFTGTSFLFSVDIDTYVFVYLSKFKYKGWCWLGVSNTVWFRRGRVGTAWFGFGMFGDTYINGKDDNYLNATMSGESWIFSLNADEGKPLRKIYVNTIELEGWDTNISYALYENEEILNKIKCSSHPSVQLSEDNFEFAKWYCVRPMTTDYKFLDIAYDDYKLSSKNPFGYIWSYGEGNFNYTNMHATRGACAMYFFETDNATKTIDDAFVCIQEGNVVSTTNQDTIKNIAEVGNYINGYYTFFNIVAITPREFISQSDFDLDYIPNSGNGTDETVVWVIVSVLIVILIICLVLIWRVYHKRATLAIQQLSN